MTVDAEGLAGGPVPFVSRQDLSQLRQDLERAVSRVCPRWLADYREDLVEVGLMRVIEVERKSEGKREFSSSYLYRVAYSALVDEIRRRRRRQEVPMDDESGEHLLATPHPDPELRAAGREAGEAIQECLAGLIRPRRLAVTLHLQGHSVPQAAKLLDWRPKRTENLVYRGLQDLRECLTLKGFRP